MENILANSSYAVIAGRGAGITEIIGRLRKIVSFIVFEKVDVGSDGLNHLG